MVSFWNRLLPVNVHIVHIGMIIVVFEIIEHHRQLQNEVEHSIQTSE